MAVQSIALGSQAELDTQLEVAQRRAYVTAGDLVAAREKLTRVGQMLHGLQRSLEKKPPAAHRIANVA